MYTFLKSYLVYSFKGLYLLIDWFSKWQKNTKRRSNVPPSWQHHHFGIVVSAHFFCRGDHIVNKIINFICHLHHNSLWSSDVHWKNCFVIYIYTHTPTQSWKDWGPYKFKYLFYFLITSSFVNPIYLHMSEFATLVIFNYKKNLTLH